MFSDYGNRNLCVRVLKGSISIVNTKIVDGTTIPKLNGNLITMPDRIRVSWQLNMPVK